MSKKYLKILLKKGLREYYQTPSLNQTLHLNHKGFKKIENLDEFTGLKVLYLDSNCIDQINGLDF